MIENLESRLVQISPLLNRITIIYFTRSLSIVPVRTADDDDALRLHDSLNGSRQLCLNIMAWQQERGLSWNPHRRIQGEEDGHEYNDLKRPDSAQ